MGLLLFMVVIFTWRELFAQTLEGKIVGGEEASILDYPYQLALEILERPFCGATLISNNYAVTASHCAKTPSDFLNIRAGSSENGKGGVVVGVKNFIVHPQYDSNLIDYDIAIIEFSQPLNFTTAIQPIGLPLPFESVAEGTVVVCSGWGLLSEDGHVSKMLNVVFIRIISQRKCSEAYGEEYITDRMICAGSKAGGRDACQGDSGGPLVRNGMLIGVVSWGNGCARPKYPGVYANVAVLRSFISNITGI